MPNEPKSRFLANAPEKAKVVFVGELNEVAMRKLFEDDPAGGSMNLISNSGLKSFMGALQAEGAKTGGKGFYQNDKGQYFVDADIVKKVLAQWAPQQGSKETAEATKQAVLAALGLSHDFSAEVGKTLKPAELKPAETKPAAPRKLQMAI
jgi:hypothetical protein